MSDLGPTEARSEQSSGLDLLSTEELVALIVHDQSRAVTAVEASAQIIARVVDAVVRRLERGGRLHYVGAGTSGRLGVLDASEIPPTFGVSPNIVCAHIAGDEAALRCAIEGAEDDGTAGAHAMNVCVGPDDAVIGISASGSARYVVSALERAHALGAYTAAIVNRKGSALERAVVDAIVLETGAEVLTGSTRLVAGTSQKIALNAISTAAMVRMGRVYDNLMVDVVASNEKLRDRALRLVQTLTGADAGHAADVLDAAGGKVKVAVVMLRRGVSPSEATVLLAQERGFLRKLL